MSIDRFLNEAPKFLEKSGKILLIQSSLSNQAKTIRMLNKTGFRTKVLSEEKFEFEKLVVIQAIFDN